MKRKQKLTFILSALLAAAASTVIFAWEPIITGAVTEEFDDNIFMDDEREWDFLTTVALGLGVEHEGKRQTFSLLGHIYQDIYIRHFDESNTSQDLELAYTAELSPNVSFALNDSFAHLTEPREFADEFGRVSVRRGYYTNDFDTALDGMVSRHFGFTLRYLNQVTFSMTDLMEDSYGNGAGANLNFFIDSANTLYLIYDYLHTEYDNGDIIQTHTPGIGYIHFFTPQLSMTLQAGLGCALTGNEVDYSPNVLAALTDDIDENNTISLTFSMSHAISRYTSEIFENWQVSAVFTRQVLERFNFAVSAFYGQGEYQESGTRNELGGCSLDFAYLLTEHISVGTGYTFTYGSTTGREVIDEDYYRDQVRLFFRAEL
ncbi:MAG TPA: hypothetical protein PK926_07535 [Spirochaetota bacterium]|nr:hypothetical protein [Spirochaetota bacterium]HPR49608.1 hypothetical protein [Spirochaetota bacterium]